MGVSVKNGLIFDWARAGPRTTSWPAHIMLDDETLRDGLQSPSVTDPPVTAKVEILHFMENLGIETVDVGLPGAGADGHPTTRGDITIGNDVWIGRGATVLSGVTVADGAVIGAGAVVAKDVPPYAIVVGNPARVVRYRFSDEVIEALLRIRWWEWPDAVIEQRVSELCDTSVQEFAARYDPRLITE